MDQLARVIKEMNLHVLSIDDVPESYSSTVYKLGLANRKTVFLKIPYSKEKLIREAESLEALKGAIPVPNIRDYWEGNEEIIGALLLSCVEGEPATKKGDRRLAYDIGVHHAKMHTVVPDVNKEYRELSYIQEEWSTFLDTYFYNFAKDVDGAIPVDLYDQTLELYESWKKRLPPPDGPSFIHMDFRPANILTIDNQVSGIIDFESARFGSTEIDFTKINRDIFLRNPGTREAYEEGYRSIRPLIDLDMILPFYRFTDAFASLGWSRRRGLDKHQVFFDKSLIILKELLLTLR